MSGESWVICIWTVLRCGAQGNVFLNSSLFWTGEAARTRGAPGRAVQGSGQGDVQEQLKGSLLPQSAPHTPVSLLPTHQCPPLHGSCQLLSLGIMPGGASLGEQKELHTGGGSDAKIAFHVYFNFTERWVKGIKAPGLQQLPVYLWQQQGKAQGVVLTHLQQSPHLGGNCMWLNTSPFDDLSCVDTRTKIRFYFSHRGK